LSEETSNIGIVKVGTNTITRYSNALIRRALEEIDYTTPESIHSININEKETDLSAGDWYKKGLDALKKKDYDHSMICYRKAIDLNTNYTEAYTGISYLYEINGNYDEAIKFYRKAILTKPQDWFPYFGMGYAYERQGNYDKAIELYEKVLEIDRRAGGNFIYYRIGHAYLCKSNKDKAIAWYKIAARLGHTNTQEWLKDNGYDW